MDRVCNFISSEISLLLVLLERIDANLQEWKWLEKEKCPLNVCGFGFEVALKFSNSNAFGFLMSLGLGSVNNFNFFGICPISIFKGAAVYT